MDETTLDCLITHPYVGSLWLADCELEPEGRWARRWFVIGEGEDRSVPERHSTFNFPVTCIRKWEYRDVF
jgi:hypothetical protein